MASVVPNTRLLLFTRSFLGLLFVEVQMPDSAATLKERREAFRMIRGVIRNHLRAAYGLSRWRPIFLRVRDWGRLLSVEEDEAMRAAEFSRTGPVL